MKKISPQIPIKFYTGTQGFKSVCQRSLDYATDEILFITDIMDWYKVYTVEYDNKHYVPERLKKNIFLKMLAFKAPRTLRMKERDHLVNRETRFLPPEFQFKSTIIIYGEEVSMMISCEPYTAIVIENKEIHDTFKGIFYNLWNNSQNN